MRTLGIGVLGCILAFGAATLESAPLEQSLSRAVASRLNRSVEAELNSDFGWSLVSLATALSTLAGHPESPSPAVQVQGESVDAAAFARARLQSLLNHLQIAAPLSQIHCDAQGSLSTRPIFTLTYARGAYGALPVAGVPLRIALIRDDHNVRAFTLRTGQDGRAELMLGSPAVPEAGNYLLVAEIDTEALGLDPAQGFAFPSPYSVEVSATSFSARSVPASEGRLRQLVLGWNNH